MSLSQDLVQTCKSALRKLRAKLPRRRRAEAVPGSWVDGSQFSWRGWLFYAPWLPPSRSYRLYIPAAYRADARLPLLVMLHGCRQDPDEFAAGTGINRLADEHGFLVLYPSQYRRFNPYRCWNWFDPAAHRGGGEAAIVAAAAATVAGSYAVDKNRVYLAGLSAGAALAAILAVRYPRRFAAAAIHAGLPYAAAKTPAGALRVMREGVDEIAPPPPPGGLAFWSWRVTPAAVFHGSADEVVDPRNADQLERQLLGWYRARYRDELSAETETVTGEGYPYRLQRYRHRDRTLLASYRVEGLGHAWSGGDGALPYNDPRGPDASRLSWEFLRAHSL